MHFMIFFPPLFFCSSLFFPLCPRFLIHSALSANGIHTSALSLKMGGSLRSRIFSAFEMPSVAHTLKHMYGIFFFSSLVNKIFKLLLLVTRAIFSFVVVLAEKALRSSMCVNTNSKSVFCPLPPLPSSVLLITGEKSQSSMLLCLYCFFACFLLRKKNWDVLSPVVFIFFTCFVKM